MPPVLKNLCSSVSLRTSTIVVGGLSLIGTLFGLIDFLVKISSLYALEKRLRISLQNLQKQQEELQELEEETNSVADNPPPSPPPDYAAIFTSFLDLLTGLTFLVYSIMILFHCLLIYGAYKGKKMLLLPWLACQFVGLIFNFILMIISFWFFSHFDYDDSEISKDLKLIPLLLFISAIAFWVVYSHFVELMEQDQYTPPDYATTVVYDQRAGNMTPDMNFQENKVIVSNGSLQQLLEII